MRMSRRPRLGAAMTWAFGAGWMLVLCVVDCALRVRLAVPVLLAGQPHMRRRACSRTQTTASRATTTC